MFSIGEFSKITGLTVKTLRFYHEQGVLVPSCIDDQSGYRYYDRGKIEVAGVISRLRQLDFSLTEIAEILRNYDDDVDILHHLVQQREAIAPKLARFHEVDRLLSQVISQEQEARRVMQNSDFQVQEKQLDPVLIAGVRMCGQYCECGKGFAAVSRKFGRYMCGHPMLLHFDEGYRENDANFEACVPIRQAKEVEGISVRELPGGRAVTLMHKGPYDELGRSYEKIITYIKEHEYEIVMPTREVYIKGPGMIFKGKPKDYLTEIQMLIQE